MTMNVPKVIDGARGPETRMGILKPNDSGTPAPGPQDASSNSKAGVPLGVVEEIEKHEGTVAERTKFRYRSMSPNMMVLLYAEPDALLPGGKIVRGRIYQAKFKNGEWETRDNWRMASGELISHKQQDEWIRKAESFSEVAGFGGFWDADDERLQTARAMYSSFVTAIKSDPKLKEMLRKDLAAADFNVVEALAQSQKISTDGGEPKPQE